MFKRFRTLKTPVQLAISIPVFAFVGYLGSRLPNINLGTTPQRTHVYLLDADTLDPVAHTETQFLTPTGSATYYTDSDGYAWATLTSPSALIVRSRDCQVKQESAIKPGSSTTIYLVCSK